VTPLGDRALAFSLPFSTARRPLSEALRRIDGVSDVVLTEEEGCAVLTRDADVAQAQAAIEQLVASPPAAASAAPAKHVVRVVYDGEDLDAVAAAIGRTREATIALHAGRSYRVAMLGFLPGFAYLREVAEPLRLPRRAPRVRVPRNSVAIAADYTGIYPYASAGGWSLLGRALDFEPFAGGRATMALDDQVEMVPSTDADAPPVAQVAPPAHALSSHPHIELTRLAGLALLVDHGRPGHMHEGVPHGGPLVSALFDRANALAGNASPGLGGMSACAIELTGNLEVTARGGRFVLADDRRRVELADGERHVVASTGRGRVTYLALGGGGIDAPFILGSRGALLAAGIGGRLVKGARLASIYPRDAQPARPAPEPPDARAPILVARGPDPLPGRITGLSVALASDRVGTRLDGWTPAPDRSAMMRRSSPMVRGAIELTPSGLVVLGPDHPTTGGYPVIGVVRQASLDAFFSRPLGAKVELTFDA
jgi:KipI family sensor histidine kinase inhibitor